jgi:hypothetical protein
MLSWGIDKLIVFSSIIFTYPGIYLQEFTYSGIYLFRNLPIQEFTYSGIYLFRNLLIQEIICILNNIYYRI